jgi:hypothetical protein
MTNDWLRWQERTSTCGAAFSLMKKWSAGDSPCLRKRYHHVFSIVEMAGVIAD